MADQQSIKDRLTALMAERGWGENELARRSGVTQPTIHRILKGVSKSPRQSNIDQLAAAFGLTGSQLAYGEGASGEPCTASAAAKQADELRPLASPRSEKALQHIYKAARDGRLTESDLLLLEQIAKRIAAQPDRIGADTKNNSHERLKNKLGNNDSFTDP